MNAGETSFRFDNGEGISLAPSPYSKIPSWLERVSRSDVATGPVTGWCSATAG
jgi:hypothetical protein